MMMTVCALQTLELVLGRDLVLLSQERSLVAELTEITEHALGLLGRSRCLQVDRAHVILALHARAHRAE